MFNNRKIIKKLLLEAGSYSGIFELIRRNNSRQERVPILVYHRLVEDTGLSRVSSSFRLRGLTVSAGNFAKQIMYLKRKYRLISLVEYIRRKKSGDSLANCAVVTFDDGFKDFLTLGWPLLKKYEVPVTIFFPKSFLTAVHWQHQLYYVLDEAVQEKAAVNIVRETIQLDLSQDQGKYLAIGRLIEAIRKFSAADRQEAIGSISKTLGVSRLLTAQEFYLTAEDLKLLASAGVELGAHGVSHSHLAELSEQQVDQEITESMAFIRNLTGRREIAFALPFSTGDEKILAKLKKSGCLCSFGRTAGLNKSVDDIFQLKRIAALDFSLAEFAYNVSGTESIL